MDKKEKLLEILAQVQELYPELDRVMITDLENPQSIILTSEENLMEVAQAYNLDEDYLDEITEEVEIYLEDDDDEGMVH